MKGKMAPMLSLSSDVTLLRQTLEENKQAAQEAVQAVKSLENNIEKHGKFMIAEKVEPLTEMVSKIEKSIKEGETGAALRAALAANNKIVESKKLNEILDPSLFEPFLEHYMAKTCDLDINAVLRRKDGQWILGMLKALIDIMNTVTHTIVEKYEYETKIEGKAVKIDAFKIVIYSPNENSATHVRNCFFEWTKKTKERFKKDDGTSPKMPRIRQPCVGKASRQTRAKLEKTTAEMKRSKEIKSYRSTLYFCKTSGKICSNILLRIGGNDGKVKTFENCVQRFKSICDEKSISFDKKKGVTDISDKDIKTVLMAIIKDKQEKRHRETGNKSGMTPIHTQKSMKNSESVARRLFGSPDKMVADNSCEAEKATPPNQLMQNKI